MADIRGSWGKSPREEIAGERSALRGVEVKYARGAVAGKEYKILY